MNWNNKVTWSEGLFIRPQLFQQQERYLEWFAHRRVAPLTPYFWGFSDLALDVEALSLGKLVLGRCSGVFPDGTPFQAPGHARLPAPLALREEHLNQRVHLALPIRAPNGEETTFEEAPGSLARFNVFDIELRDSNSIGQGPRPVQLSNLRLTLVPEKELTSAWMGLPVARVRALHGDGSAELDNEFIAPVNHYGASTLLSRWFGQLLGTCTQRAEFLAGRLAGAAGSTQAAEVSDFILLQALNRYEPLLEHRLRLRETSPEAIYALLRSLAGELATFVRVDTRRPRPVAAYDHGDPFASFKPLIEEARWLLNALTVRSAAEFALEAKPNGMYLASIDPSQLAGFESVVLAVVADLPGDQVAAQFAAHAKLAPSDRLAELVRLHLPGMGLRVLPVPPRQIPFNAGHVYFQLEARGPLWDQLVSHGGIGLHVARSLPGLRLQLWGVR
ncbi:type VI secretion system baseplate subunit TssK [Pelomonas sp. KK5]|uniref:type VI secretion system baseplate subunit TssK n=1 Tax=Pelomonas sp. KK5 TaxID=1855730 RepID=UPI00097BC026|nr:type VI secretion system baseplate subunit TssK [Pelomonas sp. KK5]